MQLIHFLVRKSRGWFFILTAGALLVSSAAAATVTLSGTVFEDVNYTGGVGRNNAAASGVARSGVRVELYTGASGGTFTSFTTTNVSGAYSFSVTTGNAYTIRVVNSSVTSSLGGASLFPVQTYRTTLTSGSVVAVTDRVGGEDPTKADAGSGGAGVTLTSLTAGSATPQSITATAASLANSSHSGIDFGFNFNTVVNTTDTGQGSLRQMITNANGMTGTQTSVFMISDGSAHSGLRAGLTNQLTSGVAVITPASAFPSISDTITLNGTSQTTNVGDTNTGTLGAGGTVGVDTVSLGTLNRPEVEIIFTGVITGFSIGAANSTLQGFAIHGGTNYDVQVNGVNGVTISGNVVGTTASAFSLPGTNPSNDDLIQSSGTISSCTISGNLLGFAGTNGLAINANTSNWSVSGNEIRGCARLTAGAANINLRGATHTFTQNLIIAAKGAGVDNWAGTSSGHTFTNNTINGNGVGTGTRQTAGVRLSGDDCALDRNIISSNYGPGVMVANGSIRNLITHNSIYSNGTITNDAAAAALGEVGIDLQNTTDSTTGAGTAPYYTINDSGDGDAGGNNLLNFPVLDTATIYNSTLVVTGWAPAGAIVELFTSDSDASGFGEGQTYLTALTEGSGSDTDATSSSYTNPVNGRNQGAETTNRFSFSFALTGGVSAGTKLTATATDGSNNTSEFSGQVTTASAPQITLSGNVFEDTGYTGGVGRSKATASGVNRSAARVEVFDGSGTYLSAATTDVSGNYSFSVAVSSSYTVRVVNSTVTSSLGGSSLIPVQTYRTTATTGSAVAVTDRVGGEDPTKADSGNGSTTLAALTAGSLTPQSITSVTASVSNITGIDFGYNFNTIVNTNDSGQGSLRQMITNSSGMSGTQTTTFMITDGNAHAGLRAGLTNQLTSGVAVITPTTQLPTPSDAITFDGTTQTTNIGNTNSGTLGTGGTVGTDGLSLSTVNRPEVEIVGNSSLGSGILMGQNNSTLKGFAIHGFGFASATGDVVVDGTGLTITQNVLGTTATSFSLPGSGASPGSALRINVSSTGSFTNNLVGYEAYDGILFFASAGAWTISNNEFRGNGRSGGSAGIFLAGSGSTVSQNLFAANKGNGVDCDSTAAASSSHTLLNNTFSGNGVGTTGTRAIAAVRLYGNTNVVDRNIITGNYGPGVLVSSGSTANKITLNSIYNNGTITNDSAEAATGQLGIDLLAAANDGSLGTAPYITVNDSTDSDTGANNLLNFPVLNTAVVTGANITLTGWARPGSIIEFFISDGATNGFGQGQTYLTVLTEGVSDADATSSAYTNPVNGLNQGADTTNKFSFTIATPGGVSAGTKLTATARDGSNNTSEFSGQLTVTATPVTLSGNVAEDTGYTGGIGRSKATASGVNRAGARVELFDGSGNYVSATTTDASGNYTFTVNSTASYTIRVVNSTVTSSLGGASLIPVQTYRTTATTGSAVAVTDRVGGEDPTKADSGNGSTTLAALTAGSLTPQSITSVTASTSNITGLDFVFNFNTIVNTNDSGQGTLRQFMTNSNGMTGTQTTAFMVSDGSAHAGLRTGLTNQLTGGVAVITVTSQLPGLTDTMILDGTTQTANIGDTNSGTLGTGGTVGVDAVTLATVNRPEVELVGASSIGTGLSISQANSVLKGFAIHGFGTGQGQGDIVVDTFTGMSITQNIIGATATSFSLPVSRPSGGSGFRIGGSSSCSITNNLIGFTAFYGIKYATDVASWTVSQNEIRGCGQSDRQYAAILIGGTSLNISQNLITANKGNAMDSQLGISSTTILNNTVTGNGVGSVGTAATAGVRLDGGSSTLDRNIVAQNYGAGVMIKSGSTTNKLTRNSIYGNGTILNDASAAATGNIGIDLQVAGNDANVGTAPYITVNDSGDGDTGANNLLNFPVLNTAAVSGTNLVLTGWARTGSIIELFLSDGASNGFGQGQTYLATVTEGVSDGDATSGAYTNPVNGLNQGADTTNKFSFTIALPAGVSVGSKLTATATDGSNNTSEFSGQVTVSGVNLSGNVFEDVTYAGGVGRNKATASGVNVSGARVELFNSSGSYVSATTSDASGNYSFTGLAGGNSYTVRVVNSTVVSSLGGSSLIPVQTYRTTATSGSAVAVTDRVGGEDPTKADAGNGSTTLAALTAGSLTPQSIISVTAGASSITGLDFGFNFNTIVNTNDSGQGSLRQFITNADAMTGTQTTAFMISDGSAHSGLRAGLTNQLTSGVAVITPTTALPSMTGSPCVIDGTTQTAAIGDTNSGTLGTGGTVGVGAVALSTVNKPEVEIVGSNSITKGLEIQAASCTIKGISIHGFGGSNVQADIYIGTLAGATVTQNIIGASASSYSLPAAATGGHCIYTDAPTGASITNNLMGFAGYGGVFFNNASAATCTVQNNEIQSCGRVSNTRGAIEALGSSHTFTGNLIYGHPGQGIDLTATAGGSVTILNNTITGNGVGNPTVTESSGIRLNCNGNTVDRNKIYSNYGAGVSVGSSATGNKITQNSIYSNGTVLSAGGAAATAQVGIDLLSSTDSTTLGTAPYYTINDSTDIDSGANNLLNFPVLDKATISGTNLILTGWARSGSIIEFFVSDSASSGFGQGQTYVTSLTEGGGSDTDATSSSYTNPVNGLNQGADTTNRFKYTLALPGSVTAGAKLTATATDGSNNTSEFSGQVTVAYRVISGRVYEDTGYSGGVGRSYATASGVGASGARVELFDGSGNYVSATTTDGSGNYSFNVSDSTSYTVRVVNSTVASSLGGSSLLPVQTYRTTCTTGSAVAVTDRVGGEDPTKADSGNGSTTLAALTAGSLTPQSITSVAVGTSDVTGADFGYNFNTIVNKNDTAQGSLRQMITNANGMTGTQISVFMISDGSVHSGLRAGITNQLTSGVAVITLGSLLPQITDTITLDATTQTTNVGDTNAGTLGAGGTVGVDAISLSTVNRPEVEIVTTGTFGFDVAAATSTIKGFALHGVASLGTNAEINVNGVNNVTITQNVIGTTATSFSLPGSNTSGGAGIAGTGTASSCTVTNNLIGYENYNGISPLSTTSTWTISQNEIRGCGRVGANFGGANLIGSTHTVSQNLFIANKSGALDNFQSGSNSHTVLNNTMTGNGVGTVGTRETFNIRLLSNNTTIDRNIIYNNYGAGVLVANGATGNKITRNSIYGNGTVLTDGGAAASGQIGIDLQSSGQDTAIGTAPYYTINDNNDSDTGGNNILNFPVLETAVVSGSNLILTGWARPSSVIEFFVSDSAANGFGQGQTYIATATEGTSDNDSTSSAYSNPVNGLNQGTDTTNRFSFTIALPGSVIVGTKITATATDGSNNTSEFSGQVTAGGASLSGNVFEDVTYAGGVGRDKATASGVNVSGARVELFDASGNYISATTTDASGNYTFSSLSASSTYTLRVVNSTVVSSLGGVSLIPVQTYRTTATTGSAVAVTDRVGGEDPTKADAGNGSTTLAALTAGSLTPQSITSVTVGGSSITGLSFGYNFNTIVNSTNTGQGSLRQFVTNSNGMTGTQSSVFMISDSSAHSGLRAGLTNQLTSGVAVITITTALPQITDTLTLDGTTQTSNIGNTNAGTLGTGGTVGVGAVTLSTVNRPEVEIIGANSIIFGIDIAANATTIKGIAIHGFGNSATRGDIHIGAFTGITINQDIIGTTASSFSLPAVATGGYGLRGDSSSGATLTNNLVGFTAYEGVLAAAGSSAWTVQNNEIRGCGVAEAGVGGFAPGGASSTVTGNLFIANKGRGVKTDADSCTYTNNTITGNGVGTAGTPMTPGFRIRTNNNTVTSNIISNNYGAGIMVTSNGTGNRITQNSIYGNGTIVNDGSAAATGNVGIDLQVPTVDNASTGTAPYYTINDSGDGDTGGNNLLNFPVLDTAVISGTNLVLTGWARAGSIIEFFISDGATNGFGQGQTYLATATEGTSDADATSSAYTNPVNGLNQGADTTNRFSFTIALPAGVSNGTKLTATATDGSNNTSEFSGQVTVGTIALSGKVYEDTTYSGGVGRSFATASGTNVSGARVELFDGSGNYVSAATTDASGNYSFSSITSSTSYTVRVVNSTVVSSLGGTSLLPVQTYRTTATSGSAVAVTDRVGGEDPTKADAGNGSTTLAALTAGSVLPQSITTATVTASAITGLDFGYNFCTLVNKNDTGQGSLRQFITNANGMTGTQSSVFMISDGSAHSGLRAGLTNQLTSGVAVITPATILPSITGAITVDGTTQTANVGDTNSGTLGTGGTVGVDGLTLSTVNRPEVEIIGSSSFASGLDLQAVNCTIKGIAIHGFGSGSTNGDITTGSFSTYTITQNVIGATASSFSAPAAATGGNGVYIGHSDNGSFTNNLVGFTGYNGLYISNLANSGWTVQNNEFRGCGTANSTYGGVDFLGGSGHTTTGNLFIANKGQGIDSHNPNGGSFTILNNTITGNGVGNASVGESSGVRLMNNNNTVDRNKIYSNYGAGAMVGSAGTGNKFTRNSIYSNGTILSGAGAAASGQIGIDLLSSGNDQSLGTSTYYTLNDDGDADTGGNNLLNYPVLDTGTIIGSNLEITGWVTTGATIEFFISDGDASNFGEGQTYIGNVVEGSGSDTDATSSSYSGNVNCFAQGTGTTVHRFKYTFSNPGGITAGTTKLTATATDGSNNTSEFSGNVVVYNSNPVFAIVTASTTLSDPVNSATNPKAIPGGVLLFTATVTNSYQARSDADSFIYTDPIPTNTKLYVGNLGGAGSGPVTFTDGATSSAVTYTFTSLASTTDDLSFSNDSGTTWTYVPTADADTCDANVTNIRINPKGTFAKSACGSNPSCVLQYRLRVK